MLKLTSATQDFSICLRCQYRLNVRQKPRPGRRRPARCPQQLRRFTSGASLQQQPSSAHDTATNDDNFERLPIRYSTEQLHPNQTNRHGNGPPRKDSLGLNVLGEPAEVLILRDKRDRFQLDSAMAKVRASGPDKNPAAEPISSSEILEKMNAERGIIDIDEACRNIESLRTSWVAGINGSITGIAYDDLVSRLHAGFTKPQLVAYLDRAGKDPAADTFDLNVEFSSRIYARSSWQPSGHTPPLKSMAPRIDSVEKEVLWKESRQGLAKDALVKRILRQCWNIKPQLQDSSLGVLDIRLRKLDLDLILNHKRDILKLISRSYDSKVEAWPQHRIVRITSDYDNAVDIVRLLAHTIENIKQSKIDLDVDSMSHQGSPAPRRELDRAMLRQIDEYTNTLVRSYGKGLRVWYLGPDDADLLETRRLIYQILRPVSSEVAKLGWSNGDKPSNASPVPVSVGSKLSMLDRIQEWSRWCSPHTQGQAREKEEKDRTLPSSSLTGPGTQANHGKSAINSVKSFFGAPDDTGYKLCGNNTPHWVQDTECHDSVTFGQVLFPSNLAQGVAEALRDGKKKIKKKGRVARLIDTNSIGRKSLKQARQFVPLVPGLVQSLESVGPLEKSEEFLQVRLSPSSKNMSLPVPVKALPDLEMRILFDNENKATSIKDVRLVTKKEKDFLQPQSTIDLRFIREQRVYANAKDDDIDPRIISFVQNSNFNIWGTERLKTPLGLSLSIPAHAVQPHNGFDPKSHDTLLVEYTSLGLEHRSSLTIPYRDSNSWPTLTYTNIEAGRVGGRRDELSLHSLRFASEQPSTTDTDPAAVSTNSESLSEDEHASILFQKTAALIDSFDQKREEKRDKTSLRMPVVKRFRRTKNTTVRKVDFPPVGEPYAAPDNEQVKRVGLDRPVRVRRYLARRR